MRTKVVIRMKLVDVVSVLFRRVAGVRTTDARRRRRLLAAVAACSLLFAVSLPSVALSDPPSLSEGGMTFAAILDPSGPEEYSWRVELGKSQVLEQIDDRHVEVRYSSGTPAFELTATDASDAQRATVPTTLAVSGLDVITLTVHHRAGNPAAGGAPFTYPVVAGKGWEGGFRTITVIIDEPDASVTPAPTCTVPDLIGRVVRVGRRILRRADCTLGMVRRGRSRTTRVARQFPPAGTVRPAGYEVGVRLG
jgi:hypothetical protein